MPITIRRAEAADAAKCGAILYSAFQKVADEHNFPPNFPSVEVATDVVSMLLANPGFYGIVAQDNDRIVGSNFADQRSSRQRTKARHADDIDEYRALQRTGGCVAAVNPIVTRHSTRTDGYLVMQKNSVSRPVASSGCH